MVKKILVGGLAAGVLLFIWQGIWWAALPPAKSLWNGFPEGEALMGEMAARNMESGIYYFPEHPDTKTSAEESKAAWEELDRLARQGPTITFAVYQADGYVPTAPDPFIKGFAFDFIAALTVTLIVGFMAPLLPGYGHRLGMCVVLGTIGILSGPLVFGSFYLFPTPLMVYFVVDAVIGWLLAGLLIAWATKPGASARRPAAK